MIQKIWTCKRIFGVGILLVLILIFILSLLNSIKAGMWDVSLLFLVCLAFLFRFLYRTTIPSSFLCMQAIKGYLSFRELKQLLQKEIFLPFLPENSKKPLLFYSERWFYIGGVYLPRRLTFDFIEQRKSFFSPFSEILVITKNGKRILLAEIENEQSEEIVRVLQNKFPECRFAADTLKNSQDIAFYRQLQKQFSSQILDKQDFLAQNGLLF